MAERLGSRLPTQCCARIPGMPLKDPVARRAYRARWHAEHYVGDHAEAHRRSVKERKRSILAFTVDYKAERGCSRCPEKDPVCLDFHHPDGEKEMGVSEAARRGWSIKRLLSEIEKCLILCANCHRKHHAGVAER